MKANVTTARNSWVLVSLRLVGFTRVKGQGQPGKGQPDRIQFILLVNTKSSSGEWRVG